MHGDITLLMSLMGSFWRRGTCLWSPADARSSGSQTKSSEISGIGYLLGGDMEYHLGHILCCFHGTSYSLLPSPPDWDEGGSCGGAINQ